MASLNKVMLIGNVTRDPEVKYTPKGSAVADLGLAINRSLHEPSPAKRVEEVTYVDVELWGRLAEIAGEYAKKGRLDIHRRPPAHGFLGGQAIRAEAQPAQSRRRGTCNSSVPGPAAVVAVRGLRGRGSASKPSRQSRTSSMRPADDDIPF